MTIQIYCLLIGVLLPLIWAGASVPFRNRQFGAADLANPRTQADQLTDGGARVVGAQANAWENLGVFVAANLAALMAGVDPAGSWSIAAVAWVVARIVHGVFYLANVPVLRIAGFAGGIGVSVWIFVMAIGAA